MINFYKKSSGNDVNTILSLEKKRTILRTIFKLLIIFNCFIIKTFKLLNQFLINFVVYKVQFFFRNLELQTKFRIKTSFSYEEEIKFLN